MQLTDTTVAILKSFARVNPSIQIRPGKIISTLSKARTVYARVETDQEFDAKFTIGDISKFLSGASLLGSPEIDVDGEKTVRLKTADAEIVFVQADPNTAVVAPEKDPTPPAEDYVVDLSDQMLSGIMKARSVLGVSDVIIAGDGKKLTAQAVSSSNPTSDSFKVPLGKTEHKFKAIFKEENLQIVPGDYRVTISKKGLSRWKSDRADYMIAIDQASSL